jgi:polar amino acid transport system permease protein
MSASFDWDTFAHYAWPVTALEDPRIASGLITTIYVAVAAQTIASVLGLAGATMQRSRFTAIRAAVGLYVLYFRGTPLLVQIVILYFGLTGLGLYRFPDLLIGPFLLPGIAQAGIIALALNKAAFMVEIVRAGFMSVDPGQIEAARALGMARGRVVRHVSLPQAARVIVPPLGNEFNGTMKDTSLLIVIGGVELFHAFNGLNGRLFRPFELFLAMSLYYLAMTTAWAGIQALIERRLNRGHPRRAIKTERAERKVGHLQLREDTS